MSLQPLTAQFKNYVSDVEIFLTWLAKDFQSAKHLPATTVQPIQPIQLTAAVFNNYAQWLTAAQNQIPPATAQRYLSSLRRFGEFLKATGATDSNPAAEIKLTITNPINLTIDQVLNDFRNELTRQKLSPSTIKNYLSDVNHYLLWAKEYIKTTGRDILQLS